VETGLPLALASGMSSYCRAYLPRLNGVVLKKMKELKENEI
jgi:hypothetical protein